MGADFTPELGHYVLVPDCVLLPGVGKIVGFEGTRPVVQSVAFPNVTVAVKRQRLVLPERCRDAEHPDCLVSEELAIDCAQFTRHRLGRGRAWIG
ncbi:MAG: hypothetical protein U0270_30280 [Labilithrix sp.]